jgi:hypothetical protein
MKKFGERFIECPPTFHCIPRANSWCRSGPKCPGECSVTIWANASNFAARVVRQNVSLVFNGARPNFQSTRSRLLWKVYTRRGRCVLRGLMEDRYEAADIRDMELIQECPVFSITKRALWRPELCWRVYYAQLGALKAEL